MKIEAYLKQHYSANTLRRKVQYWEYFKTYLTQLNVPLEQVNYSMILEYTGHLQSKGLKPISINKYLVAVEQIIEGLGLLPSNPVRGFRVKRGAENALNEPIKIQELEGVLNAWPSKKGRDIRAKVVLSLLHCQALGAGDLAALELEDVDLDKAILNVPSVGKSNSRELLLQANQIKLLDSYIHEVRPQLLAYETDKLLVTGGSSRSLRGLFKSILDKVKKQLPALQNLEHWRSSVIVHWLQHQPLLEVQEMLGHRFASSTERYQLQAVQSLQEALEKYHPLA
jgi:site-specific recombinase XerD